MEKTVDLLKEKIEKIFAKSKHGKKFFVSVLLLFAGLVFLAIGEIKTEKSNAAVQQETVAVSQSTDEYEEKLENRLISIISSIEGAGATRVMVTLESGSEDIYLHDYDYREDNDTSQKNSLERKDNYVIVDGDSGEMGIVVRVAQPKVRGVAVVCEGGGSDAVRERIVSTVTALLDISSARVSVAQMS